MTLLLQTVDDALRQSILSAGSNTNVIFYYPNAPRPEFPYTSIQSLSDGLEIEDWTDFDNNDDLNKTYGYRNLIYTLNFYGDNARQEASVVQGNIRKQSIRQQLRADANSSIRTTTVPLDLTQLVDSDFEKRFTLDITLNVPVENGTSVDDTGYYDKADVTWSNRPPD